VEGVHSIMTLHLDVGSLSDSDVLLSKVIKDLETGAEYPYKSKENAAQILRRIAKLEKCPVNNVLETVWVAGCSAEEFLDISRLAKQ